MKKLSLSICFILATAITVNAQHANDSSSQSMISYLDKASETQTHFLRRLIEQKNLKIDSAKVCMIREERKQTSKPNR